MRAWVNGRLLDDPRAPVLTVSDHGLLEFRLVLARG